MTTFKRDFSFNQDIIGVVARNVRKYRKMAGITQEQLAIDIGVSNDFLRRFETTFGKEGMSLNTLYKISIVLNIPMDKFFIEYEFNKSMYKTVANNIKKYREQKGLTTKELSNYTEIKEEYLNLLETKPDNCTISIYDLYKISVILETSIEKFFIEIS